MRNLCALYRVRHGHRSDGDSLSVPRHQVVTAGFVRQRRLLLRRALTCLAFLAFGLLIAGNSAVAEDQPKPQRIISCAPNLTEMLFALGAGDAVIGVTKYCNYPPEAKSRQNFGDLFNPSLEAMVAARPDMLALAPSNIKVERYFAQRPDVQLVHATSCDTMNEIEETMRVLGEATGHEADAERLIANTQKELANLRAEYQAKPRVRVLLVVGREQGSLTNLYAVGKGTYVDELLEIVGGENVLDASMGSWPVVNREALLKLNPDVIIEVHDDDSNAVRAEMKQAWSALPPITAVKNDAFRVLTDKHVMIPGAYLERDAKVLADLIHGN